MKKRKLSIRKIIIFVLVIVFLYSLINIIMWAIDNKKTSDITDGVVKDAEIKHIKDDNAEVFDEDTNKDNPYWNFIKMKLIDVDFSELLKQNPDTVGWIQVNGTNINYPFVQTTDNSFYLTHSFNKTKNNAGWVWMDYRNNISDFDQNTILYAHGRVDTTMFGSLKNILKSNWYKNPNNYVIKMVTMYESTLWQVFSVYKITNTNDYLYINFADSKKYQNFLDTIKNRSYYDFNTNVNSDNKIITLSTCYNDNEKVVMHAKLIKMAKK